MADTSFRVDTVPTPRLDLYGAFARDMGYFMQNNQTLPPVARSALASEQEKINKFLLYVNESFIIKGFSKYNPVPESAVDSDVVVTSNTLALQIGQSAVEFARFTMGCNYPSHLYLYFSLNGNLALPEETAGAEIEIILKVNNDQIAAWKQTLTAGYACLQNTIFLPNRGKNNYAVVFSAKLDQGVLGVAQNGAYGGGYAKLKTTQA